MAAGSTFTATIGRVNGSGFQIQERPGTWLNVSKFGPQPAIPEPGTVVRITLDGSGFVRSIEATDSNPSQPALFTERGSSMSRSIIRQVAIKAAARFMASKPDATSGEVLDVAAAFERWVERES